MSYYFFFNIKINPKPKAPTIKIVFMLRDLSAVATCPTNCGYAVATGTYVTTPFCVLCTTAPPSLGSYIIWSEGFCALINACTVAYALTPVLNKLPSVLVAPVKNSLNPLNKSPPALVVAVVVTLLVPLPALKKLGL